VHGNGPEAAVAKVREIVGDKPAYLTFDIDCLDPAFAPGTGTPVSGGLSSHQALTILRGLGELAWVGMDIVEVAPAYDHAEITAIAAATIAHDWLCLLAAKT
jgi:agmatinase